MCDLLQESAVKQMPQKAVETVLTTDVDHLWRLSGLGHLELGVLKGILVFMRTYHVVDAPRFPLRRCSTTASFPASHQAVSTDLWSQHPSGDVHRCSGAEHVLKLVCTCQS